MKAFNTIINILFAVAYLTAFILFVITAQSNIVNIFIASVLGFAAIGQLMAATIFCKATYASARVYSRAIGENLKLSDELIEEADQIYQNDSDDIDPRFERKP